MSKKINFRIVGVNKQQAHLDQLNEEVAAFSFGVMVSDIPKYENTVFIYDNYVILDGEEGDEELGVECDMSLINSATGPDRVTVVEMEADDHDFMRELVQQVTVYLVNAACEEARLEAERLKA